MDQRDVELRLNTMSLLKLAEESAFIRGDGSESCVEGFKDWTLWKGD